MGLISVYNLTGFARLKFFNSHSTLNCKKQQSCARKLEKMENGV